jgi:RimJ/RimL family protein N-acetyltransferase
MIPEQPLLTERLLLRRYLENDFEAVHEYGSDPEVARFVPFGPNTLEDTQGFINRTLSSYSDPDNKELNWAITLKDTGQLIGGGGIRIRQEESASIGYVLNRRFWGKGYATETARALLTFGFTRLNLHRMFATCDPENWASAHIMEKIGMRREGHFLEDVQKRGEWRNSYLYAILEREWRADHGC